MWKRDALYAYIQHKNYGCSLVVEKMMTHSFFLPCQMGGEDVIKMNEVTRS